MSIATWTLRRRTAALGGADVISNWSGVLVQRWNLPDTLQVSGQWTDMRYLYQQMVSGQWVDVLTGGCTLHERTGRRFSGLLAQVVEDYDTDTVTLTFESDLIRLWERNCFPNPTQSWATQTSDYDVRTGPAESVLLAYINANAGPGAIVARRTPGLTVPASAGRGGAVHITARFDVLGRLVADTAIAAGLTVDVIPAGAGLAVSVGAAADMTATARFGTGASGGPGLLGEGVRLTLAKPNVTRALVGGGGELTDRDLREWPVGTSAAELLWGRRIEQFVDQGGTTDVGELDKAGADALAAGSQPITIEAPVVDTPDLHLGTAGPLGAKVMLDLRRRTLSDRLQELTTTLSRDSDGPTVTVTGLVGSPDVGLTRTQKELLDMRKSLRKVVAR